MVGRMLFTTRWTAIEKKFNLVYYIVKRNKSC